MLCKLVLKTPSGREEFALEVRTDKDYVLLVNKLQRITPSSNVYVLGTEKDMKIETCLTTEMECLGFPVSSITGVFGWSIAGQEEKKPRPGLRLV